MRWCIGEGVVGGVAAGETLIPADGSAVAASNAMPAALTSKNREMCMRPPSMKREKGVTNHDKLLIWRRSNEVFRGRHPPLGGGSSAERR